MTDELQAFSAHAAQPGTFFDLLAVLCHGIRGLPGARQENVYRTFSANYVEYNKSVRVRFPFLDDNESQSVVYYYSLTQEHAKQVLRALSCAESDADWAMILAVVEVIDQFLDLKANMEHFLQDKPCPVIPLDPDEHSRASHHYRRFDALNPATKDYGLLLPREPCRWQRTGNRTMDSVGFNPLAVMENYIWVRPDADYRIVNLHSDFHLPPDRRLKLVTSPLSSQAPFLLHWHPENNSFEIEYIEDCTPAINARFEKAVLISAEEQAAIAVFPEMMASRASIRHCARYVRSHWELEMPSLILLPTCEYAGEEGWVNELTALDEDGGCIFAYHKQHPFRLEVKPEERPPDGTPVRPETFDEPIRADRVVYLLHVPGVGRIGFLICSDVFREGYLDFLMQELKVTLLLHVAFSPGADLMERMLATANRNLCDVVLCNTCAAWDQPWKAPEKRSPVKILNKPMINIYYPYGHKYSSPKPPPVTCTGECTGCAFIMEIANTYGGRQIPVSRRRE